MERKVLDIIAKNCDDDVVREDLELDLFESELLDSLAFIEMIIELEDEFNITIAPSELDRAQVNTPQKIINMVAERVG